MRNSKFISNASVDKKVRRKEANLSCAVCPPKKGCNSHGRWRKHGTKKPKYKNKRTN